LAKQDARAYPVHLLKLVPHLIADIFRISVKACRGLPVNVICGVYAHYYGSYGQDKNKKEGIHQKNSAMKAGQHYESPYKINGTAYSGVLSKIFLFPRILKNYQKNFTFFTLHQKNPPQ
jgi:hypothetical protein